MGEDPSVCHRPPHHGGDFFAAAATLRRVADMTGPSYPSMIDYAKRTKLTFGFKGHHVVLDTGEPTDLEFWRTDTA